MKCLKGLLFFVMLLLHPVTQGAENLVLAGGGEPDDLFDRISKQVLTEAYRRLGVKVSFLALPPQRALELSNAGTIDGEMHRVNGIEKTYSNIVKIPIPINKLDVMAFSIKKEIQINDPNDLKPYIVGIRHGIKFAEEVTKGVQVYKVKGTDQLFRMLGLWRIDVAISSRTAGIKVIRKLNLKGVRVSAQPLARKYLYHYLHRKHAALIPRITTTLTEMDKEGFIQQEYRSGIANILIPKEAVEADH